MTLQLREIRKRRFLTQTDLATMTGLTVATISRIETGKTRPHPTTIRRLAWALGVQPEMLVRR